MEASTPQRPVPGAQDSGFTRPQEPQSPSNINRTSKRQHRTLSINTVAPPRLNLGESAPTRHNAAAAIDGELDAIDKEAKIQRTVMHDFACTVDQFVAAYKLPEQRTFAHDLCSRVVSYLTASLYAETANYAPIRLRSQPSLTTLSTTPKSVSWVDVAKTPKNSGATPQGTRIHSSSLSGKSATAISGATSSSHSQTSPPKQDQRLLITVEKAALLQRPQPFALRQELSKRIAGLTLASVPIVAPTRTGWAITPANPTARVLLTNQENAETILRIFQATAIKQPETWYNYAVQGVPSTIHQLLGDTPTVTAELINEEVWAQAQQTPVSCRPSRHGASPHTGKITWIISFHAPVKAFRLFNASELSKLITKKTAITRHNPGCQGYCNPAKCAKQPRCNHCSERTDHHTGPTGLNCTHKAKCANCHGPFPAGHDHCPATPRRQHGRIIKPTRRELDSIRRQGDRTFQGTHTPATAERAPAPQPQPQPQAPGPTITVIATQPKRKRGAAVTAHEAACTPSSSSGSSNSNSTPSSQASSSGRPQRTSAPRKSLNLADLSAQSFGQVEESPHISGQDTDMDNTTPLW